MYKKNANVIFAFLGAVFILSSATFCDSQFILKLSEKLKNYNQTYPLEKVYLHTDKDIYQPGETVWFKAYAVNSVTHAPSSLSNKLYVILFDNQGNEIFKDNYLIDSLGFVNGEFTIPNPLANMICVLESYTGWQRNGDPEMSFTKYLKVTSEIIPDLKAEIFLENDYRNPDKNVVVKYKLYNKEKIELTGYHVKYVLKIRKKNIEKGKQFMDEKSDAVIRFDIPETGELENVQLIMNFSYKDKHLEWSKMLDMSPKKREVKFYPEGGTFSLTGSQKVIVKTNYNTGNPYSAEAVVFNSDNKKIASLKTNELGIGSFNISPEKGTRYYLKISGSGEYEKYYLPEFTDEGYLLSLRKITKDYAAFNLKSTGEFTERVSIVTHIRGEIYYASLVVLKNETTLEIPLANMPQGIMQVCVFNVESQLIADRSIYVNRQVDLNIYMETNKLVYAPGEIVNLKIHKKPENEDKAVTYISIFVADENCARINTSIADYLNFGSDAFQLEKYLSNYSKYSTFINDYLVTRTDLSNRYISLLNTEEIVKPPYFSADGILGSVYDRKGNFVPEAEIQAINLLNLDRTGVTSNDSGWFFIPFEKYRISDSFLELSAKTHEGETGLNIQLDESYHQRMNSYVNGFISNDISICSASSISSKAGFQYMKKFPTSKINIEEKEPSLVRELKPDYSSELSVLDIIARKKQFSLMGNKIVFTGTFNSVNNQQGALIVIDGIKMGEDISALQSISPADIANISVSTDFAEIQKYTGLNTVGVVVITSKKGEYAKVDNKYGNIKNNGFHKSKKFKAPNYSSVCNKESIEKDKRTTLFWEPEIVFDGSTKTALSFFTSSIKSGYVIRVEGVDENGNVGCSTLHFDVR